MIRADQYNEIADKIRNPYTADSSAPWQAVILCRVVSEDLDSLACVPSDGFDDSTLEVEVLKPWILRGSITGSYNAGDLIYAGANVLYSGEMVRLQDLNVDKRGIGQGESDGFDELNIGPSSFYIHMEAKSQIVRMNQAIYRRAFSDQPSTGGVEFPDPTATDPEFLPIQTWTQGIDPLTGNGLTVTPPVWSTQVQSIEPLPIWFEIYHRPPQPLNTNPDPTWRPLQAPPHELIFGMDEGSGSIPVYDTSETNRGGKWAQTTAQRISTLVRMNVPLIHNHRYCLHFKDANAIETPDNNQSAWININLKPPSSGVWGREGTFSASQLSIPADRTSLSERALEFWYY